MGWFGFTVSINMLLPISLRVYLLLIFFLSRSIYLRIRFLGFIVKLSAQTTFRTLDLPALVTVNNLKYIVIIINYLFLCNFVDFILYKATDIIQSLYISSHGTTTNYGGSQRNMEASICSMFHRIISGGLISFCITSKYSTLLSSQVPI